VTAGGHVRTRSVDFLHASKEPQLYFPGERKPQWMEDGVWAVEATSLNGTVRALSLLLL